MAFALAYVFLIIYFSDAWDETNEWAVPDHYIPNIKVAVVIPVRNESNNIPLLLSDLLSNDFKSRDIWVIDDHSEDDTVIQLQPFKNDIHYYRLPDEVHGKKAAISYGIEQTDADVIICIDGDCRVGPRYLAAIASYFEYQKVAFTTGIVTTHYHIGILESMQYLDLAGTMLITAAGIKRKNIWLANGANMAFRRQAFYNVDGFKGNKKIASGDDIFLINKMAKKYPGSVKFLKCLDSLTTTKPEKSIPDLLKQRKRWASKTRHYKNSTLVKLQIFIAMIQVWILLCFITSTWTGGIGFFSALFLLFIKWTMDYLLVAKVCRYYHNTKPLKYFLPAAFLQFFIYGFAAYAALFNKSHHWKGRKSN